MGSRALFCSTLPCSAVRFATQPCTLFRPPISLLTLLPPSPQTNTGACELCPVGKYREATDDASVNCINCATGRYNTKLGGFKKFMETIAIEGVANPDWIGCNECPDAHYQSQTGQTFCTGCPVGKYSSSSSISNKRSVNSCVTCERGTYSDTLGSLVCSTSNCELGKYANKEGAVSYDDSCGGRCPAGRFGRQLGQTSSLGE